MRLNVNAAAPTWQLVAYGLRNPWRFSFDRKTGDLYIGDVGQDKWEEIDYLKRGYAGIANFGWKHYEGNHIFDAGTALLTTGSYVPPITEYSHDGGNCAVEGGFVYRGTSVPAALGRYFYGDYCTGVVWSLKVVNGKATGVRVEPFKVDGLSGFGQDSQGRALPHVVLDRQHLPPRRLARRPSSSGGGEPAGPGARAPRTRAPAATRSDCAARARSPSYRRGSPGAG